jgi:hypothetical protein
MGVGGVLIRDLDGGWKWDCAAGVRIVTPYRVVAIEFEGVDLDRIGGGEDGCESPALWEGSRGRSGPALWARLVQGEYDLVRTGREELARETMTSEAD